MKLRSSHLLGIDFGDREIALVESSGVGTRRRIRRWARWPLPAGRSLSDPDVLGGALRQFLSEQGFRANHAIIGLPADWLIAEPREIPPTGRTEALASLRLQAERISLGDDTPLVFDAAGRFGDSQATQALLVGLPRDRLDRIKRLCTAAGLTPLAVTATGLAVADSLPDVPDAPIVLLGGHGTELVWRTHGGIRAFRPLGAGAEAATATSLDLGKLGGELRRVLTLAGASASTQQVVLVGEPRPSEEERQLLSGRLGVDVRSTPALELLRELPSAASLNGEAGAVAAQRLWPAVVLAGSQPSRLSVEFLKPKLAPPPAPRVNQKWVGLITGAILAVAVIGGLFLYAQKTEQQAVELEQRLTEMAPDLKAAEAQVARVNFGRGFYETRPPVLDCLREISRAFGPEDRIWVTNFTFRDNGSGQIQGRAEDQSAILALQRRLMENPKLAHVRDLNLREATGAGRGGGGGGGGGGSGEQTFSLSFTYVGSPLP